MKKKLFGLCLSCLLLIMGAVSFEVRAEETENSGVGEEPVAGVAIDETNFPDEAFRTILLEKYDTGNDGGLTDELTGITELSVNEAGIKDLTGVEHFIGLEKLECFGNELSSLNVSGLTSLQVLSCGKNNLSELDVSGLTSLQTLYCFMNNLSELDVSNLTLLQDLQCFENNLSELDLGEIRELRIINCGGNKLSSMDVSRLESLEILFCWGNNLNNLDVSNLTTLQALSCDSNNLSTLDVSKLVSLQKLYCNSNNLSSLDVSMCIALEEFEMLDNQATICAEDTFALSGLSGFDASKASNWVGATYDAETNTLTDIAGDSVTYTYDCGNGFSGTFALSVQAHGDTDGDTFCDTCGTVMEAEGVTLNERNFPDAVFRQYIKENFDVNADNVLEQSEIEAVTGIHVNQRGITSLVGIEYFSHLTELWCMGNEITELDVSKNTKLEVLGCPENQIARLDIGGLTGLVELNCYQNSLSSLNLSGLTALEWINCHHNNLTSLNLSDQTELTELYCNYNDLTEIDVSKCTKLEVLSVHDNSRLCKLNTEGLTALKRLECYSCNLAELDVSELTSLQTLWCGNNNLSSLDVSGLTLLQNLSCKNNSLSSLDVSGLPALSTLECHFNELSSLNVSGLTSLKDLQCNVNSLNDLDVSSLTSLQTLYCGGNNLSSLDVSNLVSLKTLVCYGNNLSSLDVSMCTALEEFNATNNQALICADDTFALSELSGFDASKASDWGGAVYDAETNTLRNISGTGISYLYDCGAGFGERFTLFVQSHADTDGDALCDNCGETCEPAPEISDVFCWSEVDGGIRIDGISEAGFTATELVVPVEIDGKPVVEIAAGTFALCFDLTDIRLAGESAYYVIENGVVYSKDRSVLHSVTAAYPERSFEASWEVKEIGAMAFANRDLPVLKFYNVRKIGEKAFVNCTVTSLYLPQYVKEIAVGAFYGMNHLDMSFAETIGFSVDVNNPYFIINNGMLMTKDGTRILIQIYKQDTTTEVRVPNGIIQLDEYAFAECPNLETVRIPASVTSIGKKTFAGFDSMTIITPEGSYAAAYAEEQGYQLIEIDTSAGVEGVQISAANFPDEVFRKYVNDSFDLDWNGVLSEDEIAKARVISKMHAGIGSFEGIEYLTELTELNASMNEAWTIDLSANQKLQNISLSMQEPATGEIKGSIGESATVVLTEFFLPYHDLLAYENELGSGELYVRAKVPMDSIYRTNQPITWYTRRESCGIGTDLSLVDADGNRYYKVGVTDTRLYIYAGAILDGEVNPTDVMPVLTELDDTYFVELVVLDSLERDGNRLLSTPRVIEGTKTYLRDVDITVDSRVTNYYTVDLAQIVGEENVAKVVGVENGTLTNGVATFCPVDFRVHEVRRDLRATYWYDTGNGRTMGVKFSFESLVSLDDCTEVPDGLEGEFDSVEALKEHIHKEMHKEDKKQHKHQQLFDAKLWSVGDDCKWFNIAPEDFPAEGVEVFIPYPEGAGKDTDFKIAHVFEHDCNGYPKGHIEYPYVMKEEQGIRFRVMGLSPIMLAYGEEDAVDGGETDDPVNPEEPDDPIEAFVTRMYRVILEREPDAGSATWIDGLKSGAFTGVRVADGFVLSEEMLNKDISNEEFVKILYRAFFGREADEGGLATWKGLLDNGCKKTYVFAGFANSTEFGKLCAEAGIVQGRAAEYLADRQTGLSEADYKVWCFVERMYTEVLGRTADEAGVRTWVGVLQDGSYTGVKVADGFLMSEEFLAKDMTDEEYVQIMYRAFFGRNADPEGLATWTNALATGWTKQRVFAGFANSNEFGVLCEQAGIVKGTAEE